jgi:hypothetical protein
MNDPLKAIKIYIRPDQDEWLDSFPSRERSKAVQAALDLMKRRMAEEADRLSITKIFSVTQLEALL